MSYYLLPQINKIINTEEIEVKINERYINEKVISKTLGNYLEVMKKQIDNYGQNWDIYKKYTNVYEYIHTIIPLSKQSISKLKPLSRSFYKLLEIYNLLHLLEDGKSAIESFHFAEGPGGFIEAIEYLRENDNDKYYGMTLIEEDNINVPGWRKSRYFLSQHKNIVIEEGADKKGDLFNVDNLWYCYEKYKGRMDLVTADGGFDFSIDFNRQEMLSTKIIFCQICFALAVQKKGGIFVLKVFDIFTQATIDLLYILSSLYERVYISKPHTSRTANSEKYIICKGYKLEDSKEYLQIFSKVFEIINSDLSIHNFLNIEIPLIFKNKLEDINAIIGQQQIENIMSTFYLLDNNKQDTMAYIKKNNVQKCIQWCSKYKLPHNKTIQQTNVFLYN